eukprot:CAMPEP_0198439504 /NCGR_PEP_ID=MMETSP1452-20131203/55227_1 /TAXON_ID=1181717 /ORGANISM="Synchroma pusillum, Strain CCMP3072" /LENGTH=166 /DNA_ID=CAMNT_0044160111 /DNA_START=26 /DNA_END=522 /DNA_ORIENTATION=+
MGGAGATAGTGGQRRVRGGVPRSGDGTGRGENGAEPGEGHAGVWCVGTGDGGDSSGRQAAERNAALRPRDPGNMNRGAGISGAYGRQWRGQCGRGARAKAGVAQGQGRGEWAGGFGGGPGGGAGLAAVLARGSTRHTKNRKRGGNVCGGVSEKGATAWGGGLVGPG